MGITSFLGLTTTGSSGSSTTFYQYRQAQSGDTNSNMTIIDSWANSVSSSMTILKVGQIISINAAYQSNNLYLGTATLFTNYSNTQIINLKLDTSIGGSALLQINSLPAKYLKKIDASSTIVDLVANDILAGTYNLFTYDGIEWVWTAMSSGSSSGTSGSGAPTTATYVLQSANGFLPNGLVLSAGSNVTITTNSSAIIINATSASGTTYTGTPPINVSGTVISLNASGVSSGSYNLVQVNTSGLITSASYITAASSMVYSGSSPISITGSVVSLLASGVTSGSYNLVQVDIFGRITSASYITTGSYTASNIGTSGVGVYNSTSGSNFQFNNINAKSGQILVTSNSSLNTIDIDLGTVSASTVGAITLAQSIALSIAMS
jgi:hypothetical protein